MKNRSVFITILLIFLLVSGAVAQDTGSFKWSLGSSSFEASVGDTVPLSLRARIAAGYHLTGEMTKVLPLNISGLTMGASRYSEAHIEKDAATGEDTKVYHDSLIIRFPLIVGKDAAAMNRVPVIVRYQGCKENLCFIPEQDTMVLELKVKGGQAEAAVVSTEKTVGGGKPEQKGLLIALLIAFVGGFLTSLTPCVYPLIPITISIFGAGSGGSRARAFLLSLIYVLGIVITFSALGFIVAKTGAVFGQFLANAWVAGLIALVFFILSLSLFGAFEMQLPTPLLQKLTTGNKGGGLGKPLFMGMVAGLIASPCTGPSLGAILTYAAVSGNEWQGLFMLIAFALGLGLPFLVLGTFSGLLAARPKPGNWMDGVKSVMGIAMIVVALYFLRNAFPNVMHFFKGTAVFFTASGVLAAVGLLLGAVHLSFHTKSVVVRLRKGLGILLVVVGIAGIAGGLLTEPDTGNIQWISGIAKGEILAQDQKKPMMVDYTAEWCAACKELEKLTFSDSLVQKELARFVCVKQDFTKSTPETEALKKKNNIRGLPTIDFYSSEGERLEDLRILGFMEAAEFIEYLQAVE